VTTDGCWITTDRRGAITGISEDAAAVLGTSQRGAVGRLFPLFLRPDQIKIYRQMRTVIQETAAITRELVLRRSDHRVFRASVSVEELADGRGFRWVLWRYPANARRRVSAPSSS
jgi:PAS domain S-box-containing protein